MLKVFIFIIIVVLSQDRKGCNDSSHSSPTQSVSSECIEMIIADIKKSPVKNPPATIWHYTYKGESVYYIPAPCCDQFNPVYNNKCSLLCHPDGGLTGKGDGKCDDFFLLANDKKLIWKDSRPNN